MLDIFWNFMGSLMSLDFFFYIFYIGIGAIIQTLQEVNWSSLIRIFTKLAHIVIQSMCCIICGCANILCYYPHMSKDLVSPICGNFLQVFKVENYDSYFSCCGHHTLIHFLACLVAGTPANYSSQLC